jgi:hypothetical protein
MMKIIALAPDPPGITNEAQGDLPHFLLALGKRSPSLFQGMGWKK